MQAIQHNHAGQSILECTQAILQLDDALELVATCAEHGTWRVIIEAGHLPEPFFDLRTRFAGEFLQKLQNYGVQLAGVFPNQEQHQQRFIEFLAEARRGRHFRAFEDRSEAIAWLASLEDIRE